MILTSVNSSFSSPRLILDNLTVERDGIPILQSLCATLGTDNDTPRGSLVGLVGPNGAGKSTLLATIAGIRPPTAGSVRINTDLQPLSTLSNSMRAQLISYLPQIRPVYWSMTARDIVRLGRYAYGGHVRERHAPSNPNEAAVISAMKQAGVEAFADRQILTLSGGEQSRVHLARVLCAQTPVLLADEPTNALDPEHQFAVMSALKSHAGTGHLVIAALHDLPLAARYCDSVIVLSGGMIAAHGEPATCLSSDLLETVFKVKGVWSDNGPLVSLSQVPT